MPKSQQSWLRSQHSLTQWNLRGGRRSTVEKITERIQKRIPLLEFYFKFPPPQVTRYHQGYSKNCLTLSQLSCTMHRHVGVTESIPLCQLFTSRAGYWKEDNFKWICSSCLNCYLKELSNLLCVFRKQLKICVQIWNIEASHRFKTPRHF
jgi:hypothetical protein